MLHHNQQLLSGYKHAEEVGVDPRPFHPADAPDLYPKKFRKEIDEFNDWLFPHINNGHYRMAFCQSPEAYDEAYEDFYDSLEKLDKRLETNRFLFGEYITDSDVRAYVTLVRWDVNYYHNIVYPSVINSTV